DQVARLVRQIAVVRADKLQLDLDAQAEAFRCAEFHLRPPDGFRPRALARTALPAGRTARAARRRKARPTRARRRSAGKARRCRGPSPPPGPTSAAATGTA